ncbi:VCBS domain-containing protein, partial [Shewanella aquimarina]
LQSGTEDTRQTLTTAQLLANTVDVDANDAGKLTIENLHADHGSILINGDGSFTFTPEKDYNGEVHFTYDVKDGHGGITHTGASTILAAVNDKAQIAGTSTVSLTEDKNVHQGMIHADGVLTITDPDSGQNQFVATSLQGQYGSLTINEHGHWTYTADNAQAAIQGLKTGESLTDTVLVHSVDGTEQKVTVTINGTDDKAVIGGVDTGSVTENSAGKDMSPDYAQPGMAHLGR